MVASLLERLRAALAGQYDVERELGAGGMGTVFLARDVTLQRYVAIKILRPENATASAAERFLREARILAKLDHPNIVPVHVAGEADGLYYYVMNHVEGETLAERLKRGPLTEEEVTWLGAELLAALEVAHAREVIHRDIKPSNIFMFGDRVLLGDFGIAKSVSEDSPPLTGAGQRVGTPAYMPPEQVSGDVTPRTDIYALGMLLYEAATGGRWSIATSFEDVDVSRYSPQFARALQPALAWSPEDRYESVTAFREALLRGGRKTRKSNLGRALAVAVTVVVVIAAYLLWPRRPQPIAVSDLAVLPVQVIGGETRGIDGDNLAHLVRINLERMGVTVVSQRRTWPWWDSVQSRGLTVGPGTDAATRLRASYAAVATLSFSDSRLRAELDVYDHRGEPLPGQQEIRLADADQVEVSDSITLRLAQIALGNELPAEVPRLTRDRQALTQFLRGEKAFERGESGLAVKHYRAAVERDSTFILAWWRMANAWRWVGETGPYPADFQRLFDQYGSELPPADSMLMEAQLAPAGPLRIAKYRDAHRAFPQNEFAAFLYGEELFNRGPLWGVPLDSAASALGAAIALSPSWANAVLTKFWACMRLGDMEGARSARDQFLQIAEVPQELMDPDLVALAFSARFEDPEAAGQRLREILSDPRFESPDTVARFARLGNAFDLPEVQVMLGQGLVESTLQFPNFRAGGHASIGLASMTLGRERSALAHFDSVFALTGENEAELQAAQWRVLVPTVAEAHPRDTARLARGREALARIAQSGEQAARAIWTLALDAYSNGNATSAREWLAQLDELPQDAGVESLALFLEAIDLAASGQFGEALRVSETLLSVQACTIPLRGGSETQQAYCNPFARAILHLKRGEWYERLGQLDEAQREWLWHEAVDIDGLPSVELPQAGEIDWALGTFGRFLRGMTAFEADDLAGACQHLSRVVEFWAESDPEYSDYLTEAVAARDMSCSDTS
jgi:tetratricopeptide (TPR) repeat protein